MSKPAKFLQMQLPARFEALIQLEEEMHILMAELPATPENEIEGYNFTLALHELCTNIVAHAYSQEQGQIQIELTLEYDPPTIHARVFDNGVPFNAGAVHKPDLENAQEHGYGLFLIEQLVDDVQYARLAEGNLWQLRRAIG